MVVGPQKVDKPEAVADEVLTEGEELDTSRYLACCRPHVPAPIKQDAGSRIFGRPCA